ncbi:hypothetical protein WA538_001891, partial [Blastocystis sp. DL]
MEEIKQIDVVTQVEDGPAEEVKEEKDIYVPEGYVAINEEPFEPMDEEHEGYIESGYMTLPDEDPDEDKAQFLYPENYEDVANHQLDILELQYQAVLNGTTLPTDSPIDELKKPSSELLPKPIDVVGDGEQQPEKKKKKKKTEKKKTWSREEILSTFLPPEKQTKKLKRGPAAPATEKKEKKHFPAAVMKQPTETPSAPNGEENEKSRVIQETMKSIRMDHVPAWAKNMSEKEVDDLVRKAASDLVK